MADTGEVAASVADVAVRPEEQDAVVAISIKLFGITNHRPEHFRQPVPFGSIYRLVQSPRKAEFTHLLRSAREHGMDRSTSGIAALTAAAPLWLLGTRSPSATGVKIVETVIEGVVQISLSECRTF